MAKSSYLFKLLCFAAVWLYRLPGGADVTPLSRGTAGIPRSSGEYQEHFPGREARIARVKKIYDSQIGVREEGDNAGPQVEKYLRYVNLPKGQAWCAAFVCWVYESAGVANPRTGWSPALFPPGRIIWKSHKSSQGSYRPPGRADIFGIWFPEKARIAHTGFIDSWNGSWVITVEGNTNEAGSREGDGVYRKRRPVRSVYAVARYVD